MTAPANYPLCCRIKKLQKEARSLARRLLGLGPRRGARVALVADTHPDFLRYFFACQYAGSDELAYLQFTSGCTRFPRGVMISPKTVMNNLSNLIGLVNRVRGWL